MRAMLLCAGLGTRLGRLSDERPKPMLPVCDHPILEYGLSLLAGHGVTEVVINLHHRGDVIQRELGDGRRFGVRIHYLHEQVILGTGGGLRNALSLLDPGGRDEPFLSMNGKLIFDVDLTALIAAYQQQPGCLGMLVVRPVPDAQAWGAVDVRADGAGLRVHDILGAGRHMFCGVHVTRPSVVARLPEGEACMIRQGYLPWMAQGATVAAFEHRAGYFAEHSTVERYLASNFDLLAEPTLSRGPGRLRGIDPTARIAPDAILCDPVRIGPGAIIGGGASVGPMVVVGAGATVEPGARLTRTVVWANARAGGEICDAVVSAEGTTRV
jgi:NDP-sugar pyrophosphorylase family protein